jgi:hypothetical protein
VWVADAKNTVTSVTYFLKAKKSNRKMTSYIYEWYNYKSVDSEEKRVLLLVALQLKVEGKGKVVPGL